MKALIKKDREKNVYLMNKLPVNLSAKHYPIYFGGETLCVSKFMQVYTSLLLL